ncbi:MAG TPA: glycosyltransferase [Caulobacteraceae bacterium]|jgi:glycosyltransferase involved in cell wall biosynthesis
MNGPPPTLHLLGSSGEGGAETYFVDLVAALKGAGLPTGAAIRGNAGREAALAEAGVETAVLPFGGPFDFSTRGGVARTAQAMGAGVVTAWMSRAARHAPRGPWRRIGRLGGYYDLKYYRGFDRLVGNTRDICDWIEAQGWPAERVSYIPNFAEAGDGAAVDRATLDTPAGVPLLLGMGRLHPSKAHDVSLAALAQIPDAWLWIAGSGPLEAELKAKASDLGVAGRVRFLGWRSDASALYRSADVCVFPSRYEPLGNTVIQAWAHGLPVVAAASKGPASLIRDGVDGRLTPIDDVDAFAAAVRDLIADAVLRKMLAAAGHARVGVEFSRDAVVAQWRALFEAAGDASCAA